VASSTTAESNIIDSDCPIYVASPYVINFKYSVISNNQERRIRWAGHEARMRKKSNAYRISVGKPVGKRPLGRPARRRVDNIKMDLR
jgi:hypothetical protein